MAHNPIISSQSQQLQTKFHSLEQKLFVQYQALQSDTQSQKSKLTYLQNMIKNVITNQSLYGKNSPLTEKILNAYSASQNSNDGLNHTKLLELMKQMQKNTIQNFQKVFTHVDSMENQLENKFEKVESGLLSLIQQKMTFLESMLRKNDQHSIEIKSIQDHLRSDKNQQFGNFNDLFENLNKRIEFIQKNFNLKLQNSQSELQRYELQIEKLQTQTQKIQHSFEEEIRSTVKKQSAGNQRPQQFKGDVESVNERLEEIEQNIKELMKQKQRSRQKFKCINEEMEELNEKFMLRQEQSGKSSQMVMNRNYNNFGSYESVEESYENGLESKKNLIGKNRMNSSDNDSESFAQYKSSKKQKSAPKQIGMQRQQKLRQSLQQDGGEYEARGVRDLLRMKRKEENEGLSSVSGSSPQLHKKPLLPPKKVFQLMGSVSDSSESALGMNRNRGLRGLSQGGQGLRPGSSNPRSLPPVKNDPATLKKLNERKNLYEQESTEQQEYQVDDNGYLIDAQGNYLQDEDGNMLQLSPEYIEELRVQQEQQQG